MKIFFLIFSMLCFVRPASAISDSELRKHFERLDLDVVSMGSSIQVQPKMCYQKRAIEIYELIKQLFILTAVFYFIYMAFRLYMGQATKPIQSILFIALALGMLEVFPSILFLFTDRDFREEKCPLITLDKATLQKEFATNEKLKEAMKKREAIEKIEKQKPTAESIWQKTHGVPSDVVVE